MKAVILAGGRGTRLFPLTQRIPKPLVPILDKPVMAHIIALLKKHGISQAAVTLGYLPELIKNRFLNEFASVSLNFFTETQPLGTAGSVKNASDFLISDADDSFLVISGDSMCDIDLGKAIEYHKSKNADLTIILKRSDDPLQFGVVKTASDGSVERFVEKPSWSQICSDKVNTGIYIIKKAILDFIPTNKAFDFSKDLFPVLMKKGLRLFGFVTEDYWCDIGSVSSFLKCNFDALAGKVGIELELDGKIFSENGDLFYLSYGAKLEPGAVICNNSIVGRDCVVLRNCYISGSVICDGALVGRGSVIKNSVICHGARIPDEAIILGIHNDNKNIRNEFAFPSNNDRILDDDGEFILPDGFDGAALSRFSDALLSINDNNLIYLSGFDRELSDTICSFLAKRGAKVYISDAENEDEAAFCACIGCGRSLFAQKRDGRLNIKIFDKDGFILSPEDRNKLVSAFYSSRANKEEETYSVPCFFVKELYYCALYSRMKGCDGAVLIKGNAPDSFLRALRERGISPDGSGGISLDFERSGVEFPEGDFFDMDHIKALIISSQPHRRAFVSAESAFSLKNAGYKVYSLEEREKNDGIRLIDYPEMYDSSFAFTKLIELYGLWGCDKLLRRFKDLADFSTYSVFRPFKGSRMEFTDRINSLFSDFKNDKSKGIVLEDPLSKINISPCALKGFRIYVQSRRLEAAKELGDFVAEKLNI